MGCIKIVNMDPLLKCAVLLIWVSLVACQSEEPKIDQSTTPNPAITIPANNTEDKRTLSTNPSTSNDNSSPSVSFINSSVTTPAPSNATKPTRDNNTKGNKTSDTEQVVNITDSIKPSQENTTEPKFTTGDTLSTVPSDTDTPAPTLVKNVTMSVVGTTALPIQDFSIFENETLTSPVPTGDTDTNSTEIESSTVGKNFSTAEVTMPGVSEETTIHVNETTTKPMVPSLPMNNTANTTTVQSVTSISLNSSSSEMTTKALPTSEDVQTSAPPVVGDVSTTAGPIAANSTAAPPTAAATTSAAHTKQDTSTKITPSKSIPSTKATSTKITSTKLVTEDRGHTTVQTDTSHLGGNVGMKVALGIFIPVIIIAMVIGFLFLRKKCKKKGRGYQTLDDFGIGNYEGLNNPNYGADLDL